ncbi:MAG TPA: AAA family ATPase [Streptosporangiaceae bacterium]|nr:AAA family ATPase [Streptosporangiaceae bacterium]
MLLGRDLERHEIEATLAKARSGESAALALVGEPGIGKTALLDYAAECAVGMRLLRARGIESEAYIPFAALLELLRPALALIDQIPAPQALALEGALALRPGSVQDRFAVGAATLSLLAAYAEQSDSPVAIVIDDAHWLDDSSAQALLFAFRRLFADSIAVLLAVREGEASLLDGADLPILHLSGLSLAEAARLLADKPPEVTERLHAATAGNPLGLLELASGAHNAGMDLSLAPDGAPVMVSARITAAFLRSVDALDDEARLALLLAATSESGDLQLLGRAAVHLGLDFAVLAQAEAAGLVTLGTSGVQFRHALARSAVYADAPASRRREVHRAIASALPDRDVDRRAWHLSAAVTGSDDSASAAMEQAGERARDRNAYASACAAFERAGRLATDMDRRARLLLRAAETGWLAGYADRAIALLAETRSWTHDPATLVEVDSLAGHIAVRRGPVMKGSEILRAAASRAEPERAVAMLADATAACGFAGNTAEMLSVSAAAREQLRDDASIRTRFLAAIAVGVASILGGDAEEGSDAIREAVALADSLVDVDADLEILPWLVVAPTFLRQSGAGRSLLSKSLVIARDRAAVGTLPFVLNLIARDLATGEQLALGEATYREAIGLARESGQWAELAFGLAGLAWLLARRGSTDDCRSCAAEALSVCQETGTRLFEVWAAAALGELELSSGDAARAAAHFEHQQQLLDELAVTDVDLSPAPELIDAYLRLGRLETVPRLASDFAAAASAKGQPWSLARALRGQAMLADDAEMITLFEKALDQHSQTPDLFETARTRLAYGARLRRTRNRVLAREQLRVAADTFQRIGARSWAERARAELAATGETRLRAQTSVVDKLTPQELQITQHLTGGRTTRETAAALFLSPKTVEYHLRNIYAKLDIHSRDELARLMQESGKS